MCAINGFFAREGEQDAVINILAGLGVMKNRGKDAAGIATPDGMYHADTLSDLRGVTNGIACKAAIGHLLHSMVSKVHEPIMGKEGLIVANCEIYNWKELCAKHNIRARNDAHLILLMIEKYGIAKIREILDELDGVFAFCYWADDRVVVARDILGVKPLWYSRDEGCFSFASEKKAMLAMGCKNIVEQNPRSIMNYSTKIYRLTTVKRKFFSTARPLKKSKTPIEKELEGLLINAISKRIPDERFGILFSGGIDSTLIATVAKSLGLGPMLYTVALDEPGLKSAEDLGWARRAAKELRLKLKVVKLSLQDVEAKLEKVVPLIEDNNVVKSGVGLVFYAACEQARKDGIRVMFSGLGSEEIFAGYERHRQTLKAGHDINKECVSGLRKLYERDLYRDDVVTMNNNIELRLPFLDKALVKYALRIPVSLKIADGKDKLILRDVALNLGVPVDVAHRKKRAAQYGSRVDRALEKLAKQARARSKSVYLSKFLDHGNVPLGVLWSSGKDSCLAMHIMKEQGYDIRCLVTMLSENSDSYMFHTPAVALSSLQAEALGIPIIIAKTKGEKEKELSDLKKVLVCAKKEHEIEGVVTGALFSAYQRDRIERICDGLSLKIFSPLWHMEQEKELHLLLKKGFHVIIAAVAAYGLDKTWIGRKLDEKMISELRKIHERYKINMAGEGGEFESLVLDAPMFRKSIKIQDYDVMAESDYVARIRINKATLINKNG